MSDSSQGPGWWIASDGKWYAPELHPEASAAAETEAEAPAATAEEPEVEQEPAAAAEEPEGQCVDATEESEPAATQELTAESQETAIQESVGDETRQNAPVYLTAATATATPPAEREPWTPTTYIEKPPEEIQAETVEPDEDMVVTATTNIVAGLIALVGAALIVVGSFLPWGEATGIFVDGSIDGFDSNGIGTLVAGVVLAGSAGLLLGGVRHVLMLVAVLGASLVAIGLAVYSMFDITGSASDKLVDEVVAITGRDAAEVAAAGTGLDVSYGLWLVLAGGAVGLISAVFIRFNE
jgi:hypothetical protein